MTEYSEAASNEISLCVLCQVETSHWTSDSIFGYYEVATVSRNPVRCFRLGGRRVETEFRSMLRTVRPERRRRFVSGRDSSVLRSQNDIREGLSAHNLHSLEPSGEF